MTEYTIRQKIEEQISKLNRATSQFTIEMEHDKRKNLCDRIIDALTQIDNLRTTFPNIKEKRSAPPHIPYDYDNE